MHVLQIGKVFKIVWKDSESINTIRRYFLKWFLLDTSILFENKWAELTFA